MLMGKKRILAVAAAVCLMVTLLAGLAAVLSVSADDAVNYAKNPGFEELNDNGNEAREWGLWPGWDKGSFITDDSEARTGDHAIKVVQQPDGNEANRALYQGNIRTNNMDVAGASKLTMMVKYTGITGEGIMLVIERKSDQDGNANVQTDRVIGSSDGWVELSLEAPATDKEINELIIKMEISSGAGTVWIDDVTLTGGEPKPPVADPNKNYARNPGFETVNDAKTEAGDWGLWPGWDKDSFITANADETHSGEYAIKVVMKSGVAESNRALYQGGHTGGNFSLASGATLSLWIKHDITAGSFKYGLERKTAGGNDDAYSDPVTGSSDGWKEYTLDIEPSDQTLTEWIIKVEITEGTGTIYIDDVTLKIKEGGGDIPEVPDDKKPGVVITGETGVNLLTNPGFEDGDKDWGVIGGASISKEDTHSGARAVKAVLGAEAYGSWNNMGGDFDKTLALRMTAWVKLDGVTGEGVTLGVERKCMDDAGLVSDDHVFSTALTGTADWQKIVVEIPASEYCYQIVVKVNLGVGEGTVYFDDFYIGLADQSLQSDNLAVNAGFENGTDTEAASWGLSPGWDEDGSAISTDEVHGGERAIRIGQGEETRILMQSNNWGMRSFDTAGAMYLSMWVNFDGLTGDGAYLKVERKANDEGVADVSGVTMLGSSGGWKLCQLVIPATEEELEELVICLVVEPGAGSILVDDVTFRPLKDGDISSVLEDLVADENGTSTQPATNDDPNPSTGAAMPLALLAVALVSGGTVAIGRKRRG